MSSADLPLEIIVHILTFVDVPSLYKLSQVSHLLRYLTKRHIYQLHLQFSSVRLWVHQPGTVAHTPIDFQRATLLSNGNDNDDDLLMPSVQFSSVNQTAIRFDPHRPILIDGCTIITNNDKSNKHYGLAYQHPVLLQANKESALTVEKHHQWSMCGEFDQENTHFKPLTLTCNAHLFNPTSLSSLLQQQITRLRNRIRHERKQQVQQLGSHCSPLKNNIVGWKSPLGLPLSASPSSSPWDACSAKSHGVMPSSPSPATNYNSYSTFISS